MKRETLTEALVRFNRIARSVTAPRPGSNHLPVLMMESGDGCTTVDGEEMDALYRAGLLQAAPDPEPRFVEGSEEWGGIDADWLWTLSPAGRQALADREGPEHG